MICVHKLKGESLWINPDLIVFVEGVHESVITLIDGKHVIASDTPDQIADAVRTHRARIFAMSARLSDAEVFNPPTAPDKSSVRNLRPVPDAQS